MQGDRGAVSVMGPPFRALPAVAPRSETVSPRKIHGAHEWILWQASVKYGQIPQHGSETNMIDILFRWRSLGLWHATFSGRIWNLSARQWFDLCQHMGLLGDWGLIHSKTLPFIISQQLPWIVNLSEADVDVESFNSAAKTDMFLGASWASKHLHRKRDPMGQDISKTSSNPRHFVNFWMEVGSCASAELELKDHGIAERSFPEN